jgi:uncharacterized protein YndB with AHSA1/START domain
MVQEKEIPKQQDNEFVIERVFNAPRHHVWKAFAEADRMAQWWGPEGFKLTVSRLEFSAGGTFHYRMESTDGFIMWGKFVYVQIIEPEKIVFILSVSNENGGVVRAPTSATWPLEIFNILTLTEKKWKN